MKLHPRYYIVKDAELELSAFFLTLMEKHELTFGEAVKALNAQIANVAKYAIRFERHGDDSDKKGDEE